MICGRVLCCCLWTVGTEDRDDYIRTCLPCLVNKVYDVSPYDTKSPLHAAMRLHGPRVEVGFDHDEERHPILAHDYEHSPDRKRQHGSSSSVC